MVNFAPAKRFGPCLIRSYNDRLVDPLQSIQGTSHGVKFSPGLERRLLSARLICTECDSGRIENDRSPSDLPAAETFRRQSRPDWILLTNVAKSPSGPTPLPFDSFGKFKFVASSVHLPFAIRCQDTVCTGLERIPARRG